MIWRRMLGSMVLMMLTVCSVTYPQQLPAEGHSPPRAQTAPIGTAAGPQELIVDGKVLGKRIETQPDLICIVCNAPIGREDFVFRVNGQRVAVHRVKCYGTLLGHPYRFLGILQPHGAFLGAGAEEQSVSFAWFLVGLYILSGLVFGALGAHLALHRGRSAVAWFGLGLALNGFGYLMLHLCSSKQREGVVSALLGLQKVPATSNPKRCSKCGKTNHPAAEQCSGCGAKLQPAVESEVRKAGFGNF
jgi:hypothetical protein